MTKIIRKNNALYVTPTVDGIQEALSFKHSYRTKKETSFFSRKEGRLITRLVDGPIKTELRELFVIDEPNNTLITYGGLEQRVIEFLDGQMIDYEISNQGGSLPRPDTDDWIMDGLHPDQVEAVDAMLDHNGGCMLEAATSAGKTFVIAALCRAYTDYTGLIVTNRQSVASRLYDALVDLCPDNKIGIYTTEKKRKGKTMIITAASLKNYKPSEIGFIIYDECIAGDSCITMSDGSTKKVRDTLTGNMISSFDEEGNIINDRITSVCNKGKRPTWEIRLESGQCLTCTSNEKIRTDRGWVYLAQLLPEANATWDSTGRCVNDVDITTGQVSSQSWSDTGKILPIQGKDFGSTSGDSTQDNSQWWMGEGKLPLRKFNFRDIRVFTNGLLPTHNWDKKIQEESITGVDQSDRLGGNSVVVSGRWMQPEWQLKTKYTRLHARGGGDADPNAERQGHQSICSQREEQKKGRALLLGNIYWKGFISYILGKYQTICSSINELQNVFFSTLCQRLHNLWRSICNKQEEHSNMQKRGLQIDPEEANSKKIFCQEEKRKNGTFSSIISIEYAGEQEVWDIETEKYHTFFANGFGVHNCHGAFGEARSADLLRFDRSVRYGLSATIENEFSGAHHYLEAIFGPVVHKITDQDVEELGRVSPLNVYILDVHSGPEPDSKTQDLTMERHGIWYNKTRNKLAKAVVDMVPDDQQLVIFVRTKYHLDHLVEFFFPNFSVYHGKLKPKEKRKILDGFNSGDIKRIISTDSLSEGVDPKALFVTINMNWMQSNVSVVQKAGRNRRLAEGKGFGVVVDFNDCWHPRFERKSKGKLSKYYNRGYTIIDGATPSTIKFNDRK